MKKILFLYDNFFTEYDYSRFQIAYLSKHFIIEVIDFTNFLMILIKQGYRVDAIKRKVDWFEFDQKEDFVSFEKKTF